MTDTTRGQLVGSAADVYERLFVPAIFGQWPPALLDAAEVATGAVVLDVGCGTGVLAAAAAERVGPTGRVVGIDPNGPMLDVARRRRDPVEWRTAAAEAIPYPDGAFDRVISQFAMMYFADRPAALGEMARVTAPDGRVAVAVWAAVAECPGYAALADVVADTIGDEAAEAIREPFCLGDPGEVRELVGTAFDGVQVRQHDGVARFSSIEALAEAEIRGWTLAETIDDEQYARLLVAATSSLAFAADDGGAVEFAMPALVATGRRRGQ